MVNDSKSLWLDLEKDIQPESQILGRYTSQVYQDDPCALAYISSRYKFCSKMLAGAHTVLEIGCGDGFGGALVAQKVKKLICTDINERLISENVTRMQNFSNIDYQYHDFRKSPYVEKMDGIYLVDVIEHIYKEEESSFLTNVCDSLTKHGICLVGTPNRTAEQYASELSKVGHVNLKDYSELKSIGESRFFNHFMFAMNDEVIHTGFPAMAHFQWLLGVGPR